MYVRKTLLFSVVKHAVTCPITGMKRPLTPSNDPVLATVWLRLFLASVTDTQRTLWSQRKDR